ncbi:MAG: hypothetical protein JWO62_3688 [Acidimicrobiaceae bacterium]|nr:hypothetical protein [Acidimicrobiaceae bacterium]
MVDPSALSSDTCGPWASHGQTMGNDPKIEDPIGSRNCPSTRYFFGWMERTTGFEPATLTLAR